VTSSPACSELKVRDRLAFVVVALGLCARDVLGRRAARLGRRLGRGRDLRARQPLAVGAALDDRARVKAVGGAVDGREALLARGRGGAAALVVVVVVAAAAALAVVVVVVGLLGALLGRPLAAAAAAAAALLGVLVVVVVVV